MQPRAAIQQAVRRKRRKSFQRHRTRLACRMREVDAVVEQAVFQIFEWESFKGRSCYSNLQHRQPPTDGSIAQVLGPFRFLRKTSAKLPLRSEGRPP
jgi:hypothetical protein